MSGPSGGTTWRRWHRCCSSEERSRAGQRCARGFYRKPGGAKRRVEHRQSRGQPTPVPLRARWRGRSPQVVTKATGPSIERRAVCPALFPAVRESPVRPDQRRSRGLPQPLARPPVRRSDCGGRNRDREELRGERKAGGAAVPSARPHRKRADPLPVDVRPLHHAGNRQQHLERAPQMLGRMAQQQQRDVCRGRHADPMQSNRQAAFVNHLGGGQRLREADVA